VTKGNTQKKVALLECWKLQVRSVVVLKALRLAITSATVAVMRDPVLGIPAMRVLAWEEKSRREGVSREEVQEEGVPCGAVLLSATLLVALLAISHVATKAVEAMKAMAVVKRVISLVVYEVEMMGRWAETDLCRLLFL
jgi:hypothetical protein